MSNVSQTWKEVPVDWEALEDAFENNAPEVHSYLQIRTGEVLRVVDGIADPDMHSRIALDPNYMRIDPVSSREQYRWMERFIPMVDEGEVQSRLLAAIDGKGAFRRFKDVLMAFAPERERWFAFRSERLRVFMEAWLSAHGLTPVARPVVAVDPEVTEEPPVEMVTSKAPVVARSAGVSPTEATRQPLLDALEGLSSRDLDKVLSYAEFLKFRRNPQGERAQTLVTQETSESSVEDSAAGPPTAQSSREPTSQRRAADRR